MEEERKALIAEQVEKLYSLVNRRRFYELLGDLEIEKVKNFDKEAKEIARRLGLTDEEVEKLADELDDYYVSGVSKHGDISPLDYWVELIYSRLKK